MGSKHRIMYYHANSIHVQASEWYTIPEQVDMFAKG